MFCIEENRAQFSDSIFGAKRRETFFTISSSSTATVTTKCVAEKMHSVFMINEYGWKTEGKHKHLKVVNQSGEEIAERVVVGSDEEEMKLFFRYSETYLASLALFVVEYISNGYSFSEKYSGYYQFMLDHLTLGD